MRVFCDTNVLIAAFQEGHPHHHSARPILEAVIAGSREGFVAAHSLAEAYAVLTRMPSSARVAPTVVWQIIAENVVRHFKIVTLTGRDYEQALARAALNGIEGGKTYDALLLAAAQKCNADRIYTLNVRHFHSLAEPSLLNRIVAP